MTEYSTIRVFMSVLEALARLNNLTVSMKYSRVFGPFKRIVGLLPEPYLSMVSNMEFS